MVKRLWRGDVDLGKTFWFFGVFILILIDAQIFIINKIENYYYLNNFGNLWWWGIVLIHFIYAPFIFIAILRSAQKYNGPKIFSYLAILLVIITTAALLIFPAAILILFIGSVP